MGSEAAVQHAFAVLSEGGVVLRPIQGRSLELLLRDGDRQVRRVLVDFDLGRRKSGCGSLRNRSRFLRAHSFKENFGLTENLRLSR